MWLKVFVLATISLLLLMPCAMGVIEVEDNVQLTRGSNQDLPCWSPDGKQIAYASNQDIWTMNSDGSNQKKVYSSIVWDGEPSFSSDGEKLYFASDYVSPIYSNYLSIHVLSLDGRLKLQLTNNADQRSPAASPDGNYIAYLSKMAGNYDVWIMDVNGSNNLRLTDSAASEGAPSWSPDGQYLACSLNGDIWLLEKDGLYQKQLTGDDFKNIEPDFSPDGSRITFTSDRDGAYDIWVINSDGTGIMKIVGGSSVQKNPAWSPDGKTIAYSSNQAGDYNIWAVKLKNTEPEVEYKEVSRNIEVEIMESSSAEEVTVEVPQGRIESLVSPLIKLFGNLL